VETTGTVFERKGKAQRAGSYLQVCVCVYTLALLVQKYLLSSTKERKGK
jgi:hypothetical protein